MSSLFEKNRRCQRLQRSCFRYATPEEKRQTKTGCTLQKTTYDSNLYNRAFPGGNALFFVYTEISLRQHRQRCRAPQPARTEPFKSFSALDNHPLFAVY